MTDQDLRAELERVTRERDEARADAKRYKTQRGEWQARAFDVAAAMKRERDEARSQRDLAMTWGAEACATIEHLTSGGSRALLLACDLKRDLDAVAEQRDEARAEADLLRAERDGLLVAPLRRVRSPVQRFALLMERALQANDHKGGWDEESAEWLLSRLREEAEELAAVTPSAAHSNISCDAERVGREAADVANFAMMIADVCGGLPDASQAFCDHDADRLRRRARCACEHLAAAVGERIDCDADDGPPRAAAKAAEAIDRLRAEVTRARREALEAAARECEAQSCLCERRIRALLPAASEPAPAERFRDGPGDSQWTDAQGGAVPATAERPIAVGERDAFDPSKPIAAPWNEPAEYLEGWRKAFAAVECVEAEAPSVPATCGACEHHRGEGCERLRVIVDADQPPPEVCPLRPEAPHRVGDRWERNGQRARVERITVTGALVMTVTYGERYVWPAHALESIGWRRVWCAAEHCAVGPQAGSRHVFDGGACVRCGEGRA